MALTWMPLLGEFDQRGPKLVFMGKMVEVGPETDRKQVPELGIAAANARFAGGEIAATFEFAEVDERTAAELMVYRDPAKARAQSRSGVGGGV